MKSISVKNQRRRPLPCLFPGLPAVPCVVTVPDFDPLPSASPSPRKADNPSCYLFPELSAVAAPLQFLDSQVEEYSNTCNFDGLILTGICFQVCSSADHLEEETPNREACSGVQVSYSRENMLVAWPRVDHLCVPWRVTVRGYGLSAL
ncbi:MAG: hypothetical protein GX125_07020 [Bacteroidales bacterium]|nr:hypothetical protein [Bacteroidales bacterium]